MASEVFSVEQVAARLGLHVRTVRNYVRSGRLKAVRIGKQYRIAAADLAAVNGPRDPGKRRLRAEAVYDEERAGVKVIVSGDLAAGADLLRLLASFAESLA